MKWEALHREAPGSPITTLTVESDEASAAFEYFREQTPAGEKLIQYRRVEPK
jgi:hypothetical protein